MSTATKQESSSATAADPAMVPPGYKRTAVGVIPNDWEIALVEETFAFLPTTSHSRAQLTESGSVACVHYGDIHTRFNHFIDFRLFRLPHVSDPTTAPAGGLLRDGDLILADASEDEEGVGKGVEICGLGQREAISGLHTLALRATDDRTVIGYRAYLFEKPIVKSQLRRIATGLKVFGISKAALRGVSLPLAPRAEQRAVAKSLSDVDGLLGALEALIAKKRAIKRAVAQQLLTAKTRLPGFRGGWERKQLREIGHFLKGRGVKRDDAQSGSLACVRYGEIYTTHEDYIRAFSSWISREVAATATPLEFGDLLFAGSGETKEDIGKCVAFVTDAEAYAGGDIVILRPNGADPLFLGYALNVPYVARQKASLGQGDAVVHISSAALGQVSLELPSLDEQTAIATVLSDMDAEIAALERRRDKTRAIKQGMMQQLLTGRVRLVEAPPGEPSC